MEYRVMFLQSAENDLIELKKYIKNHFSNEIWLQCYGKIKESVKKIQLFPAIGSIPPELEAINSARYRQVIIGMNRIVYEIRDSVIYIHIVCDTRKNLTSLLFSRLCKMNQAQLVPVSS